MNPNRNNSKLVCIRTYSNSQAAYVAQLLLADHEIVARVNGDALSDALTYGPAVSKVDLVTWEADSERALEILKAHELEANKAREAWSDGDFLWICDSCGEENASTFDYCWSCQTPVPENPRRTYAENNDSETQVSSSTTRKADANPMDASPYLPPQTSTIVRKSGELKDLETRALRAAFISLVFFPLGFYALFLCVKCILQGQMTRKTLGTMALCAVSCTAMILRVIRMAP